MRLDELDTRSRLTIAAGVGVAAALLVPGVDRWLTRGLVGWNAAVWLFLALDAAMMIRADHAGLRRLARASAEDIRTVVLTAVVAALAGVAAMFLQLQAGKSPDKVIAVAQVLFSVFTAAGSWVLLAVLFTLDYASLYYREAGEDEPGEGLQFPRRRPARLPGRLRRVPLLRLHRRRGDADLGRAGDDARDEEDRAHPLGGRVRLQHARARAQHQRRRRAVPRLSAAQ